MNSKRLKKELELFNKECPDVCTGGPVNKDDLRVWNITLFGPKNSPYEGGNFLLKVEFDQDYPFVPPDVYFITPIYHPNICEFGSICLDILEEDSWSAALTLSKTILSISSLLGEPNPLDHAGICLAEEEEAQTILLLLPFSPL